MVKAGQGENGDDLAQALVCLNQVIGRTAREMFDIDAKLEAQNQTQLTLNSMLDAAPDPGLLVVIKAGSHHGLLMLDGLLVNALVELMTGAADNSVYKQARLPTQIDMALCREFCDQILTEFPGDFVNSGTKTALPKLFWASTEVKAAKLAFILKRCNYAVLSGQINFQDGIRGGQFALALPQDVWDGGQGIRANAVDPIWAADLAENVMVAPLTLRADLDVSRINLSKVLALKSGDILTFSEAGLSDIALTDGQGATVLRGRLGQSGGHKAIAVTSISTFKSSEMPEKFELDDKARAVGIVGHAAEPVKNVQVNNAISPDKADGHLPLVAEPRSTDLDPIAVIPAG